MCHSPASLLPGAAMSAPVFPVQMRHLVKNNPRLVLHNAELAYAVVYMDLRIPDCIDRHEPLVIIPAVGRVNHALVIGLYNAEIFESGASRHHMGYE